MSLNWKLLKAVYVSLPAVQYTADLAFARGWKLTARSTGDHLIPAPTAKAPSLIERLAASHAAVLEDWKRNFGLDLCWHRAVPAGR